MTGREAPLDDVHGTPTRSDEQAAHEILKRIERNLETHRPIDFQNSSLDRAVLPADDVAEVVQHEWLSPMHTMGLPTAAIYHDFFGATLLDAFDAIAALHRCVIAMGLQKPRQDYAMFCLFLARKMTSEQTARWHRENLDAPASCMDWPTVVKAEALNLPSAFYKHASSLRQIGAISADRRDGVVVNKRNESRMMRGGKYMTPRSDDPSRNHKASILHKRWDYVRRALRTLPVQP
ncbi:hypothetical protein JOE11_004174 [Robbsia andropogonis]|uniref:YopJ family acetyltransferase n=1 Tax=Robbsia andropogonis TaxID=28092 RepID=UPI003D1B9352